MREILFRGKRKKGDKRWVEGNLTQGYAGYVGIMVRCCAGTSFEVAPETVGQYTGLTDKNGVKIFEGDVVEYSEIDIDGSDIKGKGVLRWNDNTASFEISCGLFGVNFCQALLSQVEVIGNIYDNPELMGGNTHG